MQYLKIVHGAFFITKWDHRETAPGRMKPLGLNIVCFDGFETALHALKRMEEAGHMVGPFITHNFDALGARAGFEEQFMRRYDQRIPPVTFHPDAKALVVIGLHADRRHVAKRARRRTPGLPRRPGGIPAPGRDLVPLPAGGAADRRHRRPQDRRRSHRRPGAAT